MQVIYRKLVHSDLCKCATQFTDKELQTRQDQQISASKTIQWPKTCHFMVRKRNLYYELSTINGLSSILSEVVDENPNGKSDSFELNVVAGLNSYGPSFTPHT